QNLHNAHHHRKDRQPHTHHHQRPKEPELFGQDTAEQRADHHAGRIGDVKQRVSQAVAAFGDAVGDVGQFRQRRRHQKSQRDSQPKRPADPPDHFARTHKKGKTPPPPTHPPLHRKRAPAGTAPSPCHGKTEGKSAPARGKG